MSKSKKKNSARILALVMAVLMALTTVAGILVSVVGK